jgi:hypothetical protein
MAESETPRALRMAFTYREGTVALQSVRRLAMRALPSQDLPETPERAGFWIELHDAADNVLHSLILHNPLRYDREIVPQSSGDQFTRITASEPASTFHVVVPDLAAARTVAVYGSLPSGPVAPETEFERNRRISGGHHRPAQLIAELPIPPEDG